MPFVQRVIEPRCLSRTSLAGEDGKALVDDYELEAVANNTLCNAVRQLASLVLVADDLFRELRADLQVVTTRTDSLRARIATVDALVLAVNPKQVAVPVSDIATFAATTQHFRMNHDFDQHLFSPTTRPKAVQELYEASAKTPVHLMRHMDRWRRDGHRSSRFFMCTPILGARRRRIRAKIDIDIETRVPALVSKLRQWTSSEALGDVTVAADGAPHISSSTMLDGEVTDGALSDDEGLDHKLPSPEEQLQVVALKFPAEIIAVDITGRKFDRMSVLRKSLPGEEDAKSGVVRRRMRRPRNRRRNTLAGTDQKEIQDALTATTTTEQSDASSRSKSSDLLKSEGKKSHFSTLKQWGRKVIANYADGKSHKERDQGEHHLYSDIVTGAKRSASEVGSSSEQSSSNTPINSRLRAEPQSAVKLRDSSAQRRIRRSGGNKDEPHSSSGNWSASSESGRTSIGSEITTTLPTKSTTSANTSNMSLNIHPPSSSSVRRRFPCNVSGSGSVTSEGTLTPDIIHDLHEDGETSSVYSCDTEGYYTSFHMDSGLKTLKEEDSPVAALHTTSTFTNSGINASENEYELFGKGSTSTTASSTGTVCTTLRSSLVSGPEVPERKSSLSSKSPESSLERDFSSEKTGTVKRSPATILKSTAIVHQESNGDVSPDSGHNTSSSPIESISSPNGMRSGSEFEYSESSDIEGYDRIERIRIKTTINSSRIPSMCVITPTHSDDESTKDTSSSAHKANIKLSSPSPSGGSVVVNERPIYKTPPLQPLFKATLMPLNNVLGKLKMNLSVLATKANKSANNEDTGEYVTIADVRNNNENQNEIINRNLRTVLSGRINETEYISLNELPGNEADASVDLEEKRRGARVTLNADGKVIYSSDSLKRRRGAHTTFEPGPCVKHVSEERKGTDGQPLSPQLGKVVIRAANGTSHIVRMTPATIVSPSLTPMSPQKSLNQARGAYVHMLSKGEAYTPSNTLPPGYLSSTTSLDCGEEIKYRLQKYNSLPNRKILHGARLMPERSETPDIMRGLERLHFSPTEQEPDVDQAFRGLHNSHRNYRYTTAENTNYTPTGIPIPMPSIDSQRLLSINAGNLPEMKPGVTKVSPKKSCMTNEELYAVIHRTKKKMNISSDELPSENAQGASRKASVKPETGYIGDRQSVHQAVKKEAQTSRLDFKRLLLMHGAGKSAAKLSAVEQLKLSKQQQEQQNENVPILDLSQSPRNLRARKMMQSKQNEDAIRAAPKLLSPRSQWRFANPRSDVLSSTIAEDKSEEQVEQGCKIGEYTAEFQLPSTPSMSPSQRLQLERAKFFASTPIAGSATRSQLGCQFDDKKALETAF